MGHPRSKLSSRFQGRTFSKCGLAEIPALRRNGTLRKGGATGLGCGAPSTALGISAAGSRCAHAR